MNKIISRAILAMAISGFMLGFSGMASAANCGCQDKGYVQSGVSGVGLIAETKSGGKP